MRINFVVFMLRTKIQEYEEIPEQKVLVERKTTKAEKKRGVTANVVKRWKITKAKRVKKKDIIDLRKFVESNYKAELPFYKESGIRITEILLCSSNGKCKQKDGKKKSSGTNYVLKHIKDGKEVNKNKKTKPVVCRIKGITKDSGKLEIRVPTTGNIKVSVGLSKNENVANNDNTLSKYLKLIVKDLILDRKEIPELKNLEVINMVVTGGKLFTGKLRSFDSFHRNVVKSLENQQYYYEEPIHTNRKAFDKITLRSDDERFPTISVFRNGKIDFLGSKELKWVQKVYEILKKTIQTMKLNITMNSSNLRN